MKTHSYCSMYVLIFSISILYCVKQPTKPIFEQAQVVRDIDENKYQAVKIGNQVWMAENLKVTHYRNGDAISKVTDDAEWSDLTTGAYCNYDNNSTLISTYGLLYNWYAVNDSRGLASDGWHVPTDEEWKELELYLGMSQAELDDVAWRSSGDVGGQLKETGTNHWISPNEGATNASGFKALPGGFRYINGAFHELGYLASLWTSTVDSDSTSNAWHRELDYKVTWVARYGFSELAGLSIRCLKD